jgi:hypothetical protein
MLLFNRSEIFPLKEDLKRQLTNEIDEIEADRLLNTPVDPLVEFFAEKYRIDVPVLLEDKIATDEHETKIDISRNQAYLVTDRSRPHHIAASEVEFSIPFVGKAGLFHVQPSSFTFNPPDGELRGSELVLKFAAPQHDANRLKAEFESALANIRRYLQCLRADADRFNPEIEAVARQRIVSRRERIQQGRGVAASLGYPMRRRADASQTYVVPEIRRKAVPQMPAASRAAAPEPLLETAEYENILRIVTSMVVVIERSPRAFSEMGEEDIRTHFLVQLNGQYDGQATGETFNFEGKTDILIRINGKNIFIAECEIWRGPEYLRRKIDQLLGYATWRDSKLAILVFNRTKNFSAVLSKISEVVHAHPNYKSDVSNYASDRGLCVILTHRDDSERELVLTVLAFEVPA